MTRSGDGGGLRRNYSTLHYLIHAPNFIRLFWRLLNDKRVSFIAKLPLVIGLLYFIIPLDAIPEFPLIGVGYLDDVIILYLAAKLFIKLCPAHVVQEHVRLIDDGG